MSEEHVPYTTGDVEAALRRLQEPFPPEAHDFKPQATTRDNKRAMGVPYVDPRLYQERLDAVDPLWTSQIEVQTLQNRVFVVSTVTVLGRSRSATGESMLQSVNRRGEVTEENNPLTSAEAQAFKRACTAHGLGRYLYGLPKWWADYDDQRRRFTDDGIRDLQNNVARAIGQPAPQRRTPSSRPAETPAETQPNGNGNGHAPAGDVGPTEFWARIKDDGLVGAGKKFANREAVVAYLTTHEVDGKTDWAKALIGLN